MFKVTKNNFFRVFSRLGLFPQVFLQLKEWFILELHEMIRVPHLVACPIIFILFDNQDWQEGVLKLMKNDHFLVFLAVWGFFPKFLGTLRGDLC